MVEEVDSVAALVAQVRVGTQREGIRFIICGILRAFAAIIGRAKTFKPLRFWRVFGACVFIQVVLFAGIWWGGIFDIWPRAQGHLPWKIYDLSISSAKGLLETKPASPTSAPTEDIQRHLRGFVGRSGVASRAFFSTLYVLAISFIIAAVFRVALWLAQHLTNDLLESVRVFPLLFLALGAYGLRVGVESFALSLIILGQLPVLWVQIYQILSMAAVNMATIGIVSAVGLTLLTGLSWLFQPAPLIFALHVATLPLRIATWVYFLCFVIFVARPVFEPLFVRFAIAIERALSEKSA
jgi:hypothetical protein